MFPLVSPSSTLHREVQLFTVTALSHVRTFLREGTSKSPHLLVITDNCLVRQVSWFLFYQTVSSLIWLPTNTPQLRLQVLLMSSRGGDPGEGRLVSTLSFMGTHSSTNESVENTRTLFSFTLCNIHSVLPLKHRVGNSVLNTNVPNSPEWNSCGF